MVFIVKCLICSEILKYERDNTATLCEHIRRKHPKHRPLVETTKQVRVMFGKDSFRGF